MRADLSPLRLLLVTLAGWVNRHQQPVPVADEDPMARPAPIDGVRETPRRLGHECGIGIGRRRHHVNPPAPEIDYYHRARTHLSLDKDAPDGRPIEPRGVGTVIPIPEVGGLHHRYVRRAA